MSVCVSVGVDKGRLEGEGGRGLGFWVGRESVTIEEVGVGVADGMSDGVGVG